MSLVIYQLLVPGVPSNRRVLLLPVVFLIVPFKVSVFIVQVVACKSIEDSDEIVTLLPLTSSTKAPEVVITLPAIAVIW